MNKSNNSNNTIEIRRNSLHEHVVVYILRETVDKSRLLNALVANNNEPLWIHLFKAILNVLTCVNSIKGFKQIEKRPHDLHINDIAARQREPINAKCFANRQSINIGSVAITFTHWITLTICLLEMFYLHLNILLLYFMQIKITRCNGIWFDLPTICVDAVYTNQSGVEIVT